jgi:SapC
MGYEIVDPVHHKDVKVGSGVAFDQLAGTNHCWIGISEIGEAACDFPLVFMKSHETGRFRLVALMGFQPGRNLFVMDGQFGATYLPLQFARAPFALAKTDTGDLVAAIDIDHPRSRDRSGNVLFDQSGNESAFLLDTRAKLNANAQDQAATLAFLDTLLKNELLAPLPIDLDPLGDDLPIRLDGLYTISRTKLAHLGDSAILDLHRSGYLGSTHAIANSLAQIVRLQQLHNAHAQRNSNMPSLQYRSVGLPD